VNIAFRPELHIRNLLTGTPVRLVNPDGIALDGIAGVAGAAEALELGMESGTQIGVDRIVMVAGAEFELHTHPGAHILYVLRSRGFIHVDGIDYEMSAGDSVYVPANYPHGVRTDRTAEESLELLAFGVPHLPLTSTSRMTLVEGGRGVASPDG
jgi:quercetin dioxygenase-like cupin family protein